MDNVKKGSHGNTFFLSTQYRDPVAHSTVTHNQHSAVCTGSENSADPVAHCTLYSLLSHPR